MIKFAFLEGFLTAYHVFVFRDFIYKNRIGGAVAPTYSLSTCGETGGECWWGGNCALALRWPWVLGPESKIVIDGVPPTRPSASVSSV